MRTIRKLWAAATAAATLLGGLALGVGTASAAEGDAITLDNSTVAPPTLTVTSAPGAPGTVQGHSFVALRVGYYQGAVEGATPAGGDFDAYAKSVDVRSDVTTANDAANDTRSIIAGILPTVDEDPNTDGVQNGYAASEYAAANNPVGYISANYLGYGGTPNAAALADAASKIAADADIQKMIAGGKSDYNNIFVNDEGDTTVDQSTQTATAYLKKGYRQSDGLPGVSQGVYLIVDTTADAANQPVLAGTAVQGYIDGNASRNTGILAADGSALSLGNAVATPAQSNPDPDPDPEPTTPQVTKQVALENADGTLDGDYAAEVTAQQGQLVRYKLTTTAPANGFQSATGETFWTTGFVDTPAAGQTVLMGGQNPTDEDGNVLYQGTVPMAKMTYHYVDANGAAGQLSYAFDSDQYLASIWQETGDHAPIDGNIQTGEVSASKYTYVVADGAKNLRLIEPRDWNYVKSKLPAGASWTSVDYEYSAVITADSGDVANSFKLFQGNTYDAGGMQPITATATATVHAQKATDPEPTTPQTAKQVALENADGTLDGDYAAEVNAQQGQLVRYKLTSDIPSKGWESYPGEDPWYTHMVDLPGVGETALITGGTNPKDDNGKVLYEGTVPVATTKFNYEKADGTTGYYEAKVGDLYNVKEWTESGKFAPVDGNIQTAETSGWDVDYLVGNGKTHLYFGSPSWKFINENYLPAGAHWTTVDVEYSAVITADSGDVVNSFALYQGDTYAGGGMPAITKAVTATVHAQPAPPATFGLKFTVVGSKTGKAIEGAKFSLEENNAKASAKAASTVKDARSLAAQSITSSGDTSDTTLVDAAMPIAYATEATSDANGVVTFSGLPAGSYSVTQTATADGYDADALPTFLVVIDDSGKATFTGTGAHADLVGDGVIKNLESAKTITQLPLTGDSGITVFVACMVALAGVAGFGAVRMRSVRAGRSGRA